VKYKELDEESFKQPDIYQMLAYMTATGLRESMLLYAGTLCTMNSFTFRHTNAMVHVRTLNAALSPTDLLRELGRCASAIQSSSETMTR
jgi:5-methylcytosine-specific restriction enzyme subunit McrC